MKQAVIRSVILFVSMLLPAIIVLEAKPVGAHPHVWVDYSIEARFGPNGLTGFYQTWVFDEMFSSSIVSLFDLDENGVFSEDEIEEVRHGVFEYLVEYDYFTHIKIDGRDFAIPHARDFNAFIDGHHVVYEFFLPCELPVAATPRTLHVLVGDMEYYADMTLASEGLRIQGNESVSVSYSFGTGSAFSFYGGAWEPEHLTLRFEKAS